jgi:hypothetical protein
VRSPGLLRSLLRKKNALDLPVDDLGAFLDRTSSQQFSHKRLNSYSPWTATNGERCHDANLIRAFDEARNTHSIAACKKNNL